MIQSIEGGDHLRDKIGFDSLDLAQLTVLIEREFSVDIFDKGIVNTVGEVLSKISHHG
ncbi:MAG: acyl carrier protein [Bacteroidota bacterium]